MKVRGEKGIVKFEGCKVTEPAGKGCRVQSTIETSQVKSETSEMKDVITPASGSLFTTIRITDCTTTAPNGEKQVTGQAAGINDNVTTTEFTSTSSSLTFGG